MAEKNWVFVPLLSALKHNIPFWRHSTENVRDIRDPPAYGALSGGLLVHLASRRHKMDRTTSNLPAKPVRKVCAEAQRNLI
jgi:hypothetical protein